MITEIRRNEADGTRTIRMPHCTSHYELDTCKKMKRDLEATGEYDRVYITSRMKENGIPYAKVFVELTEPIPKHLQKSAAS